MRAPGFKTLELTFFFRIQGKFWHLLLLGLSSTLATRESLKVLAGQKSPEKPRSRE